MPKVICTLKNAALRISGVNFAVSADGMSLVSEEISAERASGFLSIPGYEPELVSEVVAKPVAAKPSAAEKPSAAAKPASKTPSPAKSEAKDSGVKEDEVRDEDTMF